MKPTLTKLSLLLFVLSFLLYANSLTNGFVLDDEDLILNNSLVSKGTQSIPEILATPYRFGTLKTDNDLYRPLSLVMFATEYEFSGGKPMLSHVINVFLFSVCVVLLFYFLVAFFEGQKTNLAFLATLFFVLHPIHTEVVANIKSRDELLCFFFGISALLTAIFYYKNGKAPLLFLSLIFFFLSLFSKETSISLLFVFPLVFFFYRNDKKQRSLLIFLTTIIAAGTYLFIRHEVLGKYGANHTTNVDFIDNMLVGAPNLSTKIATSFFILGKYLQLLLLPHPLVCDYTFNSIPFTHFNNPIVWLTIIAYLAMMVGSMYLLFAKRKNIAAFALLWFLTSIALFSNFLFPVGVPMAERFLFLPSVGFCLGAALLFEKRLQNQKTWLLLAPIFLLYSFKTFTRNKDWKDNLTLFGNDGKTMPQNARLSYYFGTELSKKAAKETNTEKKQAMLQEAVQRLQHAAQIYPSFELAYVQLANAYFNLQNTDSSIHYNLIALQLNPLNSLTHYNLAGAYFAQKNYPVAKAHCLQAIDLKPDWADAYTSLALCYVQLGKTDSCILHLHQAARLNPSNKHAYELLYMVYDNLGNTDSAKKYQALSLP
jgi:tetratricopeptide (TPR) repeat protein